jgi:acyl-CoA dehydrogenase
MMGKAALAAEGCLEKGESDYRFYRNKIATAGFYADQLLIQADAWGRVVTSGDAAIQGIGDELFE